MGACRPGVRGLVQAFRLTRGKSNLPYHGSMVTSRLTRERVTRYGDATTRSDMPSLAIRKRLLGMGEDMSCL